MRFFAVSILLLGAVNVYAGEPSGLETYSVTGVYTQKMENYTRTVDVDFVENENSRFPQVNASLKGIGDYPYELVLGWDGKNQVYKGFTSRSCDTEGCLHVNLLEVSIKSTGPCSAEMTYQLDGYQYPSYDETSGSNVRESGVLKMSYPRQDHKFYTTCKKPKRFKERD